MDVDAPEPSHRQLAIERAFAEINEDTSFGTEGQRPLRRRGSPSPLAWSDLLQSARVLVISQTGSGKTYECQRCQRRLWDKGEPAFLVELAELAANKLGDLLSPEEEQRLEQWRVSQSGVATFRNVSTTLIQPGLEFRLGWSGWLCGIELSEAAGFLV